MTALAFVLWHRLRGHAVTKTRHVQLPGEIWLCEDCSQAVGVNW